MNPSLQGLSVAEPKKIVDELQDSLIEDRKGVPLTQEQEAELDRRLRTYEHDKNRGRLADDALVQLRDRLRP